MKDLVHSESSAAAVSERVMRDWAIQQEVEERADQTRGAKESPLRVKSFISLSREAGSGAYQVACAVGQELGWRVLNKNLLDCMVERFHTSRILLENVDETESNWVYDVLGTWLDPKLISHQKFVSQLACVLFSAAREEHCVIVGRGAQFLLPRKRGLTVRLRASLPFRMHRVMEQKGIDEAAARKWIEETDRGRRDFVRRFFHHELDDPNLYDLEINVERVGFDRTVEMIVAASPKS